MMECPRIVIAGTHSGVGKTSISLALVTSLKRRGFRVQVFKVGPDFLDPSYLTLASDRPCYNLDGWMMGKDYVHELFTRVTAGADIAVIEGVMGLFDGASPSSSEGSTAEIARWLEAPVLLVVDAHGIARSLAALVKGYAGFDRDLMIGGIIANRCGSDRHRDWLVESLKAEFLPPLVGAIPRGSFPTLPSRHLGLVTADSKNLSQTVLEGLADGFDRNMSVEAIVQVARRASHMAGKRPVSETVPKGRDVRIGLAHDSAFHFYYPDNLDELESQGCELVRFSPVDDRHLPGAIDGLYMGGGYPEEHAEALSANGEMLREIGQFGLEGHPIWAECGGLMALSQGIETLDGRHHRLVGLLPAWTRMLDRRKSLGYVEVTLTGDSLWGASGNRLRGHEFHYSELVNDPTGSSDWQTIYAVKRQRSEEVSNEGYQRGRTLATYVHAHFASRPGVAEHFVNMCKGRPSCRTKAG
jgi:cobyrinic acid a,c-diamide synthase